MANQQRKTKSTVNNLRLPFIGSMTNRDYQSGKDQRFVNVFPETRKVEAIESTKIFLNKRPGLTEYKDFGTGEGRGGAFFNNKIYVVVGSTVWEDAVTPVSKITLGTSTGKVGMIVCNSSTIGDYLFICDGIDGWVINTAGTATKITSDSVITVTMTAGGTAYTTAPTVVIGVAWVTATSYTAGMQRFNGANLYTATTSGTSGGTAPVHTSGTVSDGGVSWAYAGSKATATSTISSGAVTFVTITSGGSGYTSAPAISFTGGGGSAAAAVSVINAFPTPHAPSPAFLDGYVALSKGSDVYNCMLDDPFKWEPSNYLTAEMFPDSISALARQNNQIVVMGKTSIEFFFDAANPSASPFSRNDGTAIQMGCASPHCIYQQEQMMMYIAQSDSGGRAVWQINGFQPKRISDEYIDRVLDAEGDIEQVHGYGIRTMGHLFFVINLPNLGRTLVYDVDEKLWHEWSTGSGVFQYNHMIDTQLGYSYLLHISNGKLFKFDPQSYYDYDQPITLDIVTNKYDMDTINRKFLHNFRIVGDRYQTNSVDVRWTDDDYQTWSNWKTINLADDFPNLPRLGSFRRRAFQVRHTGNYPLRMESFEVTYSVGDH